MTPAHELRDDSRLRADQPLRPLRPSLGLDHRAVADAGAGGGGHLGLAAGDALGRSRAPSSSAACTTSALWSSACGPEGMSIGKVTGGHHRSARAKTLFHLIIFFGVALAMGVFVYVIAVLFSIREAWDPARADGRPGRRSRPRCSRRALLIVVAMVDGASALQAEVPARCRPTAVGFVLMLVGVWGGLALAAPVDGPGLLAGHVGLDPGSADLLVRRVGAAGLEPAPGTGLPQFAAALPGAGALLSGHLRLAPEFAAPAFRPHPEGAPSFYPFVFIIIACGAASGFHSLVASGTTAKQIDNETRRPLRSATAG